jgi:hypothetical protein
VLEGTNGMSLAHVKHLVLICPRDHAVSNAGMVYNMSGAVAPADESTESQTDGMRFRRLAKLESESTDYSRILIPFHYVAYH